MPDRYARNKNLINEEQQALLRTKTAAVVGLGGLGGHIAEQLARLGLGRLILIDCDAVDETNLNRQLFATAETVGITKTLAAQRRLELVNPETILVIKNERLTSENSVELLAGADIVMDATDNATTRLVMQDAAKTLTIPLVHGSIGGLWGQVCFIAPGDDTLSKLYTSGQQPGIEQHYGNPACTAAVVASIQVSEALKYFLGWPELLQNKLLHIDLMGNDYQIISFS